jgi:hypothetical protein
VLIVHVCSMSLFNTERRSEGPFIPRLKSGAFWPHFCNAMQRTRPAISLDIAPLDSSKHRGIHGLSPQRFVALRRTRAAASCARPADTAPAGSIARWRAAVKGRGRREQAGRRGGSPEHTARHTPAAAGGIRFRGVFRNQILLNMGKYLTDTLCFGMLWT